ncbi:MAG: alpha/beta hydrolase-fold protein [Bacteroidales bacterium]
MKTKSIAALFFLVLFISCNSSQDTSMPGIISFKDFKSQHVAPRNVEVWLPPDYDPAISYDVLYMHDGQNVFNPKTSYTGVPWGADQAMDSLLAAGAIRPAIVVGIWNTDKRLMEYMPNKPRDLIVQKARELGEKVEILSDNYLKFIVQELKPFIDTTFSTNSGQQSTFIMGSSMGGLISLYAISEYPGVFGGAACLSTHWPIGDGVVIEYFKDNLPAPHTHRLYFDYGTENLDSIYEPFQQRMDTILLQRGYEANNNWMTLKVEGGDHSEASWRERVHIPLEFLLGTGKASRQDTPKSTDL